MSKEDDLKFFAPWLVSTTPNEAGEYRMRCPIHGGMDGDQRPSATINFGKKVFHCNKSSCVGGLSVSKLKEMILEREGAGEVASYDPFVSLESDRKNVVDISTARAKRSTSSSTDPFSKSDTISEMRVRNYFENLWSQPELVDAFQKKRGLSADTMKEYLIGYETKSSRYTIPIRNEAGDVVNIRKYQIGPADGTFQKMANHTGYGSPPRLYPLAVLAGLEPGDTVYVVEGELDALIMIQNGLPAVSGTGGAGKWEPTWSKNFDGLNVVVIYDNDPEGNVGAHKVKTSLLRHAASVRVLKEIVPENHGDVTDYFQSGGTVAALLERIAELDTSEGVLEGQEAPFDAAGVDLEPVDVRVVGSMDGSTNGKPLRMVATVSGIKAPTYGIPAKVVASCSLDAGAKCKNCSMLLSYEGEVQLTIPARDHANIARLIDVPEDKRAEVVRAKLGAQPCNRFTIEQIESHTVQEIFVTSPIEQESEADHTQRRVYTVGRTYDTRANTELKLTGTTWPNPKDGRNEFYAWEVEQSRTSVDSFRVTPEFVERMQKFKPRKGQSPIEKAREIAEDLSQSVTMIFGRERLHMAMDLVWHSAISFMWQGSPITRGWLELAVVGDTRTGKSETALRLREHYRLGHFIGCEGATFAGLVGGVKQMRDSWTIQWGEYALNDRRLVVLDEVSGLSYETINAMSDIRVRGVAQITKVEHGTTSARVRSIWVSNARKSKFVDEKLTDGVMILQDVIGNKEDIARFDFAMSVKESDVPTETINRAVVATSTAYPSQDCHDLILWAWSRKTEDIVWHGMETEDPKRSAYHAVFEAAKTMGSLYVPDPPLVERASVKEKIARMAVALAIRTFSTDSTGEKVLVKVAHVQDAARFMHSLYKYPNFAYYHRSQRFMRNDRIARHNYNSILRYMRENPAVAEFLIEREGSFRSQDMEEMLNMDRDEVKLTINILASSKMIAKEKSQIIINPILKDLLKEVYKK